MDSISLTFKKLLHVVCVTGMGSLLWLQNAELQREGKGCDSMANNVCVAKFPSSFGFYVIVS